MPQPNLTFFTELDREHLTALFSDSDVIKTLKSLHAAVSVGVLDLSDERAKVVKKLNKAKIPVIAWLLLPKSEGYWFNTGNYPQAIARYHAFIEWTQAHKLDWAGIGLDIEPDINDFIRLKDDKQAGKFAVTLFHRYRDRRRAEKAPPGLSRTGGSDPCGWLSRGKLPFPPDCRRTACQVHCARTDRRPGGY